MPAFSTRRIRSTLAASDRATTTTDRGRFLEELTAYLFSKCPGVRHYRNNTINASGSSEVDVCFWNSKTIGSLDFLPGILVSECKNTGERVGSPAVRIFLSKLIEMGLTHGLLIAAQGITGEQDNLRAAHDVIRTAFLQQRILIIVITRHEIELLQNTDDLIKLLQDKILLLTMQAITFHL